MIAHPAEEIWRAASEPNVDLVVVGARGLGPIKRLLLGSVFGDRTPLCSVLGAGGEGDTKVTESEK